MTNLHDKLQSTKNINSFKFHTFTSTGDDRIKRIFILKSMCEEHKRNYNIDLFPNHLKK